MTHRKGAEDAEKKYFIAFAETPKAINLQPFPATKRDLRQAVGYFSVSIRNYSDVF
jgi:hypothetical protein